MTQDKAEHHVILASTILLLLFAGLTLFVASIARANPGPDAAAAGATFKTKCAMGHGPDGGGSEVGKSMHVPDLRSQAGQKTSDTELAPVISHSRGGTPAFKESLCGDQGHDRVAQYRT